MTFSKHFTFEELVLSQTAIRMGINNSPDRKQALALKALCIHLLDPIRDFVDSPIVVTSGFRCPLVNRAIGSNEKSQHIKGQAVDIICPALPVSEFFEIIKNNFEYDQCILEFNSWVHVSYVHGKNRMQVFKIGC